MKKIFLIGSVVASMAMFNACQDNAWDDHYDSNGSATATMNIMEAIESDSQLSRFASIVREQGLDALLSSDQTFTVWAPTNDALSSYVTDANTVDQFIKNHVNRYIYTPSDLADTVSVRVKMLNGKSQDYARGSNGYTFADIAVTGTDIAATNGIVHTLSGRIPFYANIYEQIKDGGETDSLAAYLKGFDEYEFDKANSTSVGRNEYGQTVYDSVYNYSSDWMRKYGSLYLEDSTYTMIVPTDKGWRDGYEKVKAYFKTFGTLESSSENTTTHVPTRQYAIDDALADSLTDVYTKENMVNNLVFRRRVDPFTADGDSLVNTAGNAFHNLAELFGTMNKQSVSNGTLWKMDEWTLRPTETFLKEIEVEAEDTKGRTSAYANVVTRSASSTIYSDSVSGQKYIEVTATTDNARRQPRVQLTIPNVLAATYDIYVVFAPAEAYSDDVTPDSTRVNFRLNYVHENGKMSEGSTISGSITKSIGMTNMYVTRMTFPFSNFSSSEFGETEAQDNDCVRLTIEANVANTETTKMTRTMRIDKVVFKPVADE